MESRDKIIHYINELLNIEAFDDYGPQGLQVEGKSSVSKVVTAVSASLELFQRAHQQEADMIIVHHGILWDKDSRVVKGFLKKRLVALLAKDISLLAYHLPLDAHQMLGNNAIAALAFGILNPDTFADVGMWGKFGDPYESEVVFEKVKTLYESEPLIYPYGPPEIRTIGICSGCGQNQLKDAIEMGLDCYVTGESSEFVMHLAKENKIHYIAAGHYATERLGIRTLGEQLAQEFEIEVEFIDIPNPV